MQKRIIAVILAVITLSLALVSCKSNGETDTTEAVYYTVTFNSNGGSAVKQQRVMEGAKLAVPQTPEYTNYVFSEWRYNGKTWDFDYDTVKGDMELKAEWISADNLFKYSTADNADSAFITGFKDDYKGTVPKDIALPEIIGGLNVVGVADGAFKDTSSDDVTSITLPSTVVSVGNEAFDGCADITLNVKGALTHIGTSAFGGCNGLSSISFGEGLTEIAAEAFIESGIRKAVLPKSLTLIGEDAFKACASLTVAVIYPMSGGDDMAIENSAFRECDALKTVFFCGTDEELDALLLRTADGNESFTEAKLSLYSESEPKVKGDFWHFIDGEPREW